MRLLEALRAGSQSRIAFVGAGGKTTAMFSLARQLAAPMICLNTAHLSLEQAKLADKHLIVQDLSDVERLFQSPLVGVTLITGPGDGRGRLMGLHTAAAEKIKDHADEYHLPILVEADGSRMLPLKAPAAHEPPIPAWVEQVVVVAGLSALGKPLTGQWVYQPEVFAQLSGAQPGQPILTRHLVATLLHPQGGLKNIPAGARRAVLANQLDDCGLPEDDLYRELAKLPHDFELVMAGSVQKTAAEQVKWRCEPVGGVILAAGESIRMGTVKQLLPWRGKPLVRHVAEKALAAGLNPVVIVTGAAAEGIEKAVDGLPVELVYNRDWESGQASSIRVGIQVLKARCGAAVFLLSDMPQFPVSLIEAELEIHRRESVEIVVPRVNGQRTNPVLFDRSTFAELVGLVGDTGGRALFDRHPLRWLDLEDAQDLLDVDTPADYQRLVDEGEDG